MSNVEVAVSLFEEGSLCSQAVLTAWEQELGLDRETALKVFGNNIFTVCPKFVRNAVEILEQIIFISCNYS